MLMYVVTAVSYMYVISSDVSNNKSIKRKKPFYIGNANTNVPCAVQLSAMQLIGKLRL